MADQTAWLLDVEKAKKLAIEKGYQAEEFKFELTGNYGENAIAFVTFIPVGIRRSFPSGLKTDPGAWLNLFAFDLDYDRFRDVLDSRVHERETRLEMMRQNFAHVMKDWDLRHDRVMRQWEHRINFIYETSRSLVTLSTGAMKTLAILNGGAAAAVLQFMHKDREIGEPLLRILGYSLECFVVALFLCLGVSIMAYLAQYFYSGTIAWDARARKIGNRRIADRFRYFAIGTAVLSGLLFLIGSEIALNVMLNGESFLAKPIKMLRYW